MENALTDSLLKSQGLTTGVIFVATSLYGAFLVLFILSSLILHSQIPTSKKQSSGSLGTSIYLTLGYMLFLAVSSSWVLLCIISTHPSLGQTVEDSTGYGTFFYIQAVTEVFAAVVADWILLYRLYIIWNKKSIILIVNAIILILQAVVVVYGSVYYAQQKTSWIAGIFILTSSGLLTNIGGTVLIVWKLWNTTRHILDAGGQTKLSRVMVIIMESAAITTTYMIVYLVLYVTNREAAYPLLHILPSVAGITASLVNVRVGFGWAAGEQGRTTWSLRESIINNPVTE